MPCDRLSGQFFKPIIAQIAGAKKILTFLGKKTPFFLERPVPSEILNLVQHKQIIKMQKVQGVH